MPTTFSVISLGVQAIIDPNEGNTFAENASALVGLTLGDLENPLWEKSHTFSPGTGGFGGGTGTAYDMNNNASSENFRIDGGPNQTFDGTSIYNATISYVDGTTATITAVIFQDTAGNTYLAPEFSANGDQTVLQAGPIRSLTLNSLSGNNYTGLTGNRQTTNFAVCFTQGTRIRTPDGERPVETLKLGDPVDTLDNGAQPIRWIGGRSVPAIMGMEPVAFAAGSLGAGLPRRAMALSRQHRVMLDNPVAERMTGNRQVLVPAHKLAALPDVEVITTLGFVTYWHFLCDAHEVVFAEGAPVETLYLGAEARNCLTDEAITEISRIFPDLVTGLAPQSPVRSLLTGARSTQMLRRLLRNNKSALAPA
ncbi:MAG: Hint domain-containing protein [Sulfitobacter sp.]